MLPKLLEGRVFPEIKDNLCGRCQEPLLCAKCDADAETDTGRGKRRRGKPMSKSSHSDVAFGAHNTQEPLASPLPPFRRRTGSYCNAVQAW